MHVGEISSLKKLDKQNHHVVVFWSGPQKTTRYTLLLEMNYVSRLQQWLIWRKKTVDWPCNYLNESDPRSNVHYLSSSENKAWKKFRPVRDLNPWPLRYQCSALPTELTSQLRAGHYAVYSSLHGFIHGWFIVRCSLFHYCSSSAHYCEDHFHSRLKPQFKYMTFPYS